MSCPTCDHSMDLVSPGLFHCERCGTLLGAHADGSHLVPKLVRRCREFRDFAEFTETQARRWRTLGISESVDKPADRK